MQKFEAAVGDFDKEDAAKRLAVMEMVLHTCDVGNPVYDFELATIWSLRII